MCKSFMITILLITFLFNVPSIKYETYYDDEMYNNLLNAEEYLKEKFAVDTILISYSNKDTFRANYSLKENKDIRFSVVWWVNKNKFVDDYLENCLTYELNQLLSNELSKHNILNYKIHIGSMIGPPADLSDRLYGYYKKLNRIPQIDDIKHNECFSYIEIVVNNSNDKTKAYEILDEMDLPTKKLEVSQETQVRVCK